MAHNPNDRFAPYQSPHARIIAGADIRELDLRHLCHPGLEVTVYVRFLTERVPWLRLRGDVTLCTDHRDRWELRALMGPEEAGREAPRDFEHDAVYVVWLRLVGVQLTQVYSDFFAFSGVIPAGDTIFRVPTDPGWDPRTEGEDCETCAERGSHHVMLGASQYFVRNDELAEQMRGRVVDIWFSRYPDEDPEDEE